MPACGKSSLGVALASKLNRPLYDSDLLLEEKYSKSITSIFEDFGEEKFRSHEISMLKDVISRSSGIISLGGGGVLAQQNRELIKNNNLVFYIKASVPTLVRNLSGSDERPLLNDHPNKEKRINQLLEERDAIYNECSDLVIDVDNLSLRQTIEQITDKIPDANIR